MSTILKNAENGILDGTAELVLSIIQYYEGKAITADVVDIVELYDSKNPYESIMKSMSKLTY